MFSVKSYVEAGILMPIDQLLARCLSNHGVCSEEVEAFLALMMAQCREGHVCLHWEGEIDPLEAPLWEMAHRGAAEMPQEWVREIVEGDPLPLAPIYRHGPRYYFQKHWTFETEVVEHLQRLMQHCPKISMSIKKSAGLNAQQQTAVEQGVISPVSLIVGGPGTGKTFTASHLVQRCLEALSYPQKEKFRIILTAPTGKAVAHLQNQLAPVLEGMNTERILSGTLHALLRVREGDEEGVPPFLLADLILVDECSMIDARLFARLLSAVPSGSRLVLIGDADQLPAVGTGCFFADLTQVAEIPKTQLLECKRTANPHLTGLASLKGICSELNVAVFDQVLEKVIHWWPPVLRDTSLTDRLAKLERFRLLSCLRQGPWGVDALNTRLFSCFRSQLPDHGWWVIPILITKNDEATQLYNGDTGILVRKIGPELQSHRLGVEDYALFPGKEMLPAMALPAFEYAYCLSVHKSQGSEYDEVVLIVPEGSERFGKEILYTAVTRSRESLVVYGSLDCIEKMLEKSSFKRSGLAARLGNKQATNGL